MRKPKVATRFNFWLAAICAGSAGIALWVGRPFSVFTVVLLLLAVVLVALGLDWGPRQPKITKRTDPTYEEPSK